MPCFQTYMAYLADVAGREDEAMGARVRKLWRVAKVYGNNNTWIQCSKIDVQGIVKGMTGSGKVYTFIQRA